MKDAQLGSKSIRVITWALYLVVDEQWERNSGGYYHRQAAEIGGRREGNTGVDESKPVMAYSNFVAADLHYFEVIQQLLYQQKNISSGALLQNSWGFEFILIGNGDILSLFDCVDGFCVSAG